MIDKSKCCGCGVCKSVCKFDAVQMTEDKAGFLYPVIDKNKCIGCGLCEKHCPIIAHDTICNDTHHIENYAGFLISKDELIQSASGGAATAIAKHILSQGGVVFGVAYSHDYRKAFTIKVSSFDELIRIKDSKYIQSEKNDIYNEVKRILDTDTMVFYTGTPCEIGAIKAFLGKKYDNFYTCEVICHGPTSYKVAEQYLNEIEKKYGKKLKKMSVKSKELGWSVPHIKLDFEDGTRYEQRLYHSEYGIALSVMMRDSCHSCAFKGDNQVADITVGDFWGAKPEDAYWNEGGISAICINTEQGKRLFSSVNGLKLFEVKFETISNENPNLVRSEPRDKIKKLFVIGFYTIGLKRTVFLYRIYRMGINHIKKWIRRL